jgi:hypothetical protein
MVVGMLVVDSSGSDMLAVSVQRSGQWLVLMLEMIFVGEIDGAS